jgi:uncharacterized membrane protein
LRRCSGQQWKSDWRILGAAGGITGCFLGYQGRVRLVRAAVTRNIYIVVLEDILTIRRLAPGGVAILICNSERAGGCHGKFM